MPEFIIENDQVVKPTPVPVTALAFIAVPIYQQRINEQSVYADIINRCKGPVLDESRATNGHESTHMLQSELRNAQGGKVNAFYLLAGVGCIVSEPPMRKSAVGAYVPGSLRLSRFDLYVAGQHDWDDCPLYLCDEWSAYINGCAVALDDAVAGRIKADSDEACGPIELGVYCVAMAMAVKEHAADFFSSDKQFLPFMQYQWQRCLELFAKAAIMFPWDSQDKIVSNLKTSPDAEPMRAFIKLHLNGLLP